MYSSTGDRANLRTTARIAQREGKNNIAFMAFFLCGDSMSCVELLTQTQRVPEAAFFARTYAPDQVHYKG